MRPMISTSFNPTTSDATLKLFIEKLFTETVSQPIYP
ncbi:Uncharacterised protein [Sphingobacterium spiritivorum]|uniref:Uncharacterized protein n=1 Tax=Sphingobacterium spiritivorum TaxID=258 RepID=A0A380BJM3_SPHSI|nr:Uncharacterised protein [Sphingobacterium spiritivorum]